MVQREVAHLIDNQEVEVAEKSDEEEAEPELEKETAKVQDLVLEITAENLKNFSIYDVVMPLPGHSIKMPTNPDIVSIYADLLREDGVT